MVPKKHKSKRIKASDRYKVQRKVRQHHRKLDKLARKNPPHKKINKDPGIPAAWPFKEKLLAEIEERKQRVAEERRLRRQQLQQQQKQPEDDEQTTLASIAADAQQRQDAFHHDNTSTVPSTISNVPSSSSFYHRPSASRSSTPQSHMKEFKKVLNDADIVLHVLDARDPIGTRCHLLDHLLLHHHQSTTAKKCVIVLNKIDLVPRAVVKRWLRYLRSSADWPVVAVKCSTQLQRSNLATLKTQTPPAASATATDSDGIAMEAYGDRFDQWMEKVPEKMWSGSEAIGTDHLLAFLKSMTTAGTSSVAVRTCIGIVGLPNVGKSSLINSLVRSRACTTGTSAGVTTHAKNVHLGGNLYLLDSPGIVPSSHDEKAQVLSGSMKVEWVHDPAGCVAAIAERCSLDRLCKQYNLVPCADVKSFLVQLARHMGRLSRGGIAQLDATARNVLQDWIAGKIPYYTEPPKDQNKSQLSAKIVTSFAPQFQIDMDGDEQKEFLVMPTSVPTADPEQDMEELMDASIDSDEGSEDAAMEEDDSDFDDEFCPEAVPLEDTRPVTHLKEPVQKKTVRFAPKQDILTSEERELNPQVGLSRKRALKQMKRQERRQNRMLDSDGDEEMVADEQDVVVDARHGGIRYDVLRDA